MVNQADPSSDPVPSPSLPEFGVYVHFPYCAQRCPYCDFAIAVRRTIRHQRYLTALTTELAAKAPLFAGRRSLSIYFGGGTPSLWQPDCLAEALRRIRATFPPTQADPWKQEVTVECDPAELRHNRDDILGALRRAGVNRLSIGAQSFTPSHLSQLGRRHTPQDTVHAVAAARAAGFDNLSIDLMIGLVGQSPSQLDADLDALLSLRPEHVSLYMLTVEPRTPLGAAVRRGQSPGVDPDAQAAAYDRVRSALDRTGYRHYEISNFCRRPTEDDPRDLRAVHNRLYWTGGEYLGLGVGAHSFRRQQTPSGAVCGQRFANGRGIDPYYAVWAADAASPAAAVASRPFILAPDAPGLALLEDRSPDDLAREAMWLSLRQVDGVSAQRFQSLYGVDPRRAYADTIADLRRRRLLADDEPLRLTPQGLLLGDDVGAAFL